MKHLKSVLLISFLLPFFSACAYMDKGSSLGEPVPPAQLDSNLTLDTQRYLNYFQQVGRLSPEARKREFLTIEASFLKNGDIYDRLRLIYLLNQPNTGFENQARAGGLLRDAYQRWGSRDDLTAFSMALLQLYRQMALELGRLQLAQEKLADRGPAAAAVDRFPDRRRMEERIDVLEQKLKAEQKRADQAQNRAEILEKQLAALKRLEQRLNRIP
ncbi:hypothetical protein [Thermithiobacillus plumbiphilus]|uniref:Lipoprotein n=1 Tax=Thermithiobacillus plumbiphilus TaxID=1729899 RepID=A0ABU9D9V0_9PROT